MIQSTFEETSEDYKAFVDKFKPKKTTDDCYTPANIYEAVLEWAAKKYGFDKSAAVRPSSEAASCLQKRPLGDARRLNARRPKYGSSHLVRSRFRRSLKGGPRNDEAL